MYQCLDVASLEATNDQTMDQSTALAPTTESQESHKGTPKAASKSILKPSKLKKLAPKPSEKVEVQVDKPAIKFVQGTDKVIQTGESGIKAVQVGNPVVKFLQADKYGVKVRQVNRPTIKVVQAAEKVIRTTEPAAKVMHMDTSAVKVVQLEKPALKVVQVDKPAIKIVGATEPAEKFVHMDKPALKVVQPDKPFFNVVQAAEKVVRTTEDHPAIEVIQDAEKVVQSTKPTEKVVQADKPVAEVMQTSEPDPVIQGNEPAIQVLQAQKTNDGIVISLKGAPQIFKPGTVLKLYEIPAQKTLPTQKTLPIQKTLPTRKLLPAQKTLPDQKMIPAQKTAQTEANTTSSEEVLVPPGLPFQIEEVFSNYIGHNTAGSARTVKVGASSILRAIQPHDAPNPTIPQVQKKVTVPPLRKKKALPHPKSLPILCTCQCSDCRSLPLMRETLKETKKKLSASVGRERREHAKYLRVTQKKPTLRELTKELKSHLNEVTYEFMVAQFQFEDKREIHGQRWHTKIKEIMLTVYRDSKRAYKMMRKVFHLPSRAALLLYEKELKELILLERELMIAEGTLDENEDMVCDTNEAAIAFDNEEVSSGEQPDPLGVDAIFEAIESNVQTVLSGEQPDPSSPDANFEVVGSNGHTVSSDEQPDPSSEDAIFEAIESNAHAVNKPIRKIGFKLQTVPKSKKVEERVRVMYVEGRSETEQSKMVLVQNEEDSSLEIDEDIHDKIEKAIQEEYQKRQHPSEWHFGSVRIIRKEASSGNVT